MRLANQSTNELDRGPTSPRRTRAVTDRSNWAQQAAQAIHAASVSTHERVAGQGRPAVSDSSRQRVADDEQEHRGHRGEGEESGDECAGDVGGPLGQRGGRALSHRPDPIVTV